MSNGWEADFKRRMRRFEGTHPNNGMSVSVKVRVSYGCFHREHSPHASELIDREVAGIPEGKREFEFIEHESGPELLTWVSVGMSGLSLALSAAQLVVAIIQARRAGVETGDRPSEPVELIVRRTSDSGFHEEMVLRVGMEDRIDPTAIETALNEAVQRIADTSRPGRRIAAMPRETPLGTSAAVRADDSFASGARARLTSALATERALVATAATRGITRSGVQRPLSR
jgi:hypothetical protein